MFGDWTSRGELIEDREMLKEELLTLLRAVAHHYEARRNEPTGAPASEAEGALFAEAARIKSIHFDGVEMRES